MPVLYQTPGDPAAQELLGQLSLNPNVTYDFQVFLVTDGQNVDLSSHIVHDSSSQVARTCTAEVAGTCSFTLDPSGLVTPLVWGYDVVQIYQLISIDAPVDDREPGGLVLGTWYAWPTGQYVVTSPQTDLQTGPLAVTGYERTYLLQNELADSYVASAGTTYSSSVFAMLYLAGILTAQDGSPVTQLSDLADYPGDWSVKTIPTDPGDMAYPLDGSGYTYIQIANALLKASGCQPLFCNETGRFQIIPIATPKTAPVQWTFSASKTSYAGVAFPFSPDAVVIDPERTIKRDVWNVPNQWVFVQQGLAFQPTGSDGSDGQYIVDNKPGETYYQIPSDQASVKRVLRTVQFLSASGSTDLIAQGDAIVQAQLATAEQISFSTAPWPTAWHFDVFWYTDDLPDSPVRKVQAQTWTNLLEGDPMAWQNNVVAPQ